jgi:hypothetical protein
MPEVHSIRVKPRDQTTPLMRYRLQFLQAIPIEVTPMDLQKIRVAILDDNAKFRNHLAKLLGKQPDISVVT